MLWGHGLRANNIGDYVKKPMVDCTGNEILAEFLHHLGLEDRNDDLTAHARVSLAGMPYITSHFMPRAIGDRPRAIPDGCVNLGFVGQFVEVDGDCVFTVETSVRTAMEAVYGLLQLDKPIIPVSPTRYDVRHLAASIRAVLDIETFHVKDLLQLLAPAALHPPRAVRAREARRTRQPDPQSRRRAPRDVTGPRRMPSVPQRGNARNLYPLESVILCASQ